MRQIMRDTVELRLFVSHRPATLTDKQKDSWGNSIVLHIFVRLLNRIEV